VKTHSGFTLVEVLIALAITAFVSAIAYTSLSTVILGAGRSQETADRNYEVNRAWMMISRDLSQLVSRPVRDEFGDLEPALQGGPAARFELSFTRTGWHNPVGQPRSHLQRINYRLEDETLWRDSYSVLDRVADTVVHRARLLDGVEQFDILFLDSLASVQSSGRTTAIDTRAWPESWVADTSTPGVLPDPPLALEIRLQLSDWGELRRLYALPPI